MTDKELENATIDLEMYYEKYLSPVCSSNIDQIFLYAIRAMKQMMRERKK